MISFPMWVKTTRCVSRTNSVMARGIHGMTRVLLTGSIATNYRYNVRAALTIRLAKKAS